MWMVSAERNCLVPPSIFERQRENRYGAKAQTRTVERGEKDEEVNVGRL